MSARVLRRAGLASAVFTIIAVAACGGGTPSAATPSPSVAGQGGGGGTSGGTGASGPPPATAAASDAPEPTPGQTDAPAGAITLRGHLEASSSDPLSSASQTIDYELVWNAAPDDIHDLHAFRFTQGTYTGSVSIDTVCGGSRDVGGALVITSETLAQAELGPDDQLVLQLIDYRIEEGIVSISTFSGIYVQERDPAGCNDSSRYGVPVCPLEFKFLGVGRLEEAQTCEDESRGVSVFGTLVPVP